VLKTVFKYNALQCITHNEKYCQRKTNPFSNTTVTGIGDCSVRLIYGSNLVSLTTLLKNSLPDPPSSSITLAPSMSSLRQK